MFVGVSMPMSLRAIEHRWAAGKAVANGSAFQPEVNDSLLVTETVYLVSDLAGLTFYKDAVSYIGDQCELVGRRIVEGQSVPSSPSGTKNILICMVPTAYHRLKLH